MDKIYIIEDDENIRNLLKIALEGFGYEAEGFETAEEGLERIKEEVPSLAIFDWMLPGMDGVTAIRKIRQTDGLQELPIMLLTAKEKELDKVVGLDCGADDVADDGDVWTITTSMEDFTSVRDALESKGVAMESSSLAMVPKNLQAVDVETGQKVMRLMDALDESDDVQNVYTNADFPDDMPEE